MAELLDNNLCRIRVNRLVNRCHHTKSHKFFNHFGRFFGHTVGQFLNRDNLGNNDFFNDLFCRSRLNNRFRLFLFKPPPRTAETVIVIIVIGADIVNIDLALPPLRFKRTFGYLLFAFLFKNFFPRYRPFRLTIAVIFIFVIIKIPALPLFKFVQSTILTLVRFGISLLLLRLLSGFFLRTALFFFLFFLPPQFLFFFLFLPQLITFFFLLPAFIVKFFGFGNQLQFSGRFFIDLCFFVFNGGFRADSPFLANLNLHHLFAVGGLRPDISTKLQRQSGFSR